MDLVVEFYKNMKVPKYHKNDDGPVYFYTKIHGKSFRVLENIVVCVIGPSLTRPHEWKDQHHG